MDLRNLTMDAVRLTEMAAIASSRYMGWGDKNAADQAAVDAMREMFQSVPADGTIVIGEGKKDEAPMLYIGEQVGTRKGPSVDVAVDPLEGTSIVAQGGQGALSVLAFGPEGAFLKTPEVYMMKLAVGPRARGAIDLNDDLETNVQRAAAAKGISLRGFTCILLERERNQPYIDTLRKLGCRIRLIQHGDVSAALATCLGESGVDMLVGIGNSPEGILSAAALQCFGGDFQGRLHPIGNKQENRLEDTEFEDLDRVYTIDELARPEELLFACTGVTDGEFLDGVRYDGKDVITQSMVLRSTKNTRRYVRGYHREDIKIGPDSAPLIRREKKFT